MNHETAFAPNEKVFRQKKISFAEIPNQSKLFVDFQNDHKNVQKFYPSKNIKLNEFSNEVLTNYQINRKRLCEILKTENERYEAGEKAFENIEKLRENDCLAVLTGQQAGLFSGAVYSIYKALSAIKLAEDLSDQGIKAVPVFWIASEDHDFAEISKTIIPDSEENLSEIAYVPKNQDESVPIGFINIDENITDSINKFIEALPKTEFTDELRKLLAESYRTNKSFSDSFGKLLAQLFKDYGLIFVSPMNKDLRELCSPIYIEAIRNANQINENLLTRNDEISSLNYHSQVLVEADFFPFFYIDENQSRNALRLEKNTGKIISQNGKYEFTKDQLLEIAENFPDNLSPNALMRPIVQDFVFPTLCYFGGGAEIAYFAQNSVIYEILKRPKTPIRHRSSFSIIPGKNRRTLDKFELEFKDLFQGKQKILAEIIENHLNPNTAKLFEETENTINSQLDRLDKNLQRIEPTLADNLANRRKKIIWHVGTLRKKFHRAETLKNSVINRQLESVFTNCLPKDVLQERHLNYFYFYNLYGENLIKWLYEAVDADETGHQIIIF